MSGGTTCKCKESTKKIEERNWVVVNRKCNYSAFNGYKRTPSDYSAIKCQSCIACWRTKAGYVKKLRDFKKQ